MAILLKNKAGDRSFQGVNTRLWNDLPTVIENSESVETTGIHSHKKPFNVVYKKIYYSVDTNLIW